MTNNTLIIDYDNFCEVFKLKTNHIDSNASYGGCMFETYDEELAYVKDHAQEYIWTILDGDTMPIISSGYHWVNRIGYLISETAIPDDLQFEVQEEKENIIITTQHILNIAADISPDMDDGEAQELLNMMHDEIISEVNHTISYRLKDLKRESSK